MDLKQIKELMAAMGRAGIKKLTLKEKTGYEIHLERHDENAQGIHPHGHYTYSPQVFSPAPPHPQREVETTRLAPSMHKGIPAAETAPIKEKEGQYVTAPLVGTFYNAPSPDNPPFVKVGDRVDENTVMCIIEAMKVMNEVKAGVSGVVEEILVENAHPVEFGTKIFRVV